jgi:hypothetical protein
MNMKMEDNGDMWRIIEIDESNYKAVCDLIEQQHLDMTPEECINSLLEVELKRRAWVSRIKRRQGQESGR